MEVDFQQINLNEIQIPNPKNTVYRASTSCGAIYGITFFSASFLLFTLIALYDQITWMSFLYF